MKQGWKIFWIVVVIFAAAGTAAFFWGKSIWNKITFGVPRLLNLNLNGITLLDLSNIAFNGASKEVTATVQMPVNNGNNFAIPFSSLKVMFYYKGTQIAETSDLLAGAASVPANGTFTGTDTVKIILNAAGINMLIDKITQKKIMLDYKISAKVFGIPIPSSLQNQSVEL